MLQKAHDFSKLKTQQSTWHPASWPPIGKKILAPDAWHLSPGTCRLAHLSITSHRHLHLIIINRPAVPSLRLESGSSWGCPPGPGAFRRSPAFVIPNLSPGTCRLARLNIRCHRHLHPIIKRPAVPSLRLEPGSSWGCNA